MRSHVLLSNSNSLLVVACHCKNQSGWPFWCAYRNVEVLYIKQYRRPNSGKPQAKILPYNNLSSLTFICALVKFLLVDDSINCNGSFTKNKQCRFTLILCRQIRNSYTVKDVPIMKQQQLPTFFN